MQQQTYQVQLPTFQGPLDLLLHLIEQQQLDITSISLAQVTDQYLVYLRKATEIVPGDLADFLRVAARLLLIKSRVLLPKLRQVAKEKEDVGEDLVRQLCEYRRFKQVAQILEQRDQDGLHAYPRATPPAERIEGREPRLDLLGISSDDLRSALLALLQGQSEPDSEFPIVPYTVTINDKIARIVELLHSQKVLTFDSLLDDATSRIETIVTLLAILEMIRDQRVFVRQERLFGNILITPGEKSRADSLS